MLKQPLFILNFILLIAIGLLNFIATHFYLYWIFWWFDIPIHFLGGFWVGSMAIWFFFFSGFIGWNIKITSKGRVFYISLMSAIIVGLLWEIFEIYATAVIIDKNYPLDTIIDIVMDILGASGAAIYVLLKFLNNKEFAVFDKYE